LYARVTLEQEIYIFIHACTVLTCPLTSDVPHVYAEQIRALQSSTALDLGTQQHIRATTLVPHPGIPKTTAHVTIRCNVAPRGFEARARPRYYAPYFEDGESEADPTTIEKYYYAPPPHFRALCTELCVFRLLLALEDTRSAEEDEGTCLPIYF
jgi:hypothetical protein